jgi:hypothetical protein
MDLSNNQLEGLIPPDVIRLGNLRLLKLSGNLFNGNIPKLLDSCQSLEFLDLDSSLFSNATKYLSFAST